jgi:hypothetical protein
MTTALIVAGLLAIWGPVLVVWCEHHVAEIRVKDEQR